MTAGRQQQIEQLLMNLLPVDGSTVGNAKLFEQVNAEAGLALKGIRASLMIPSSRPTKARRRFRARRGRTGALR